MVGQSVLRECLRDDGVEVVLAIGRGSTGWSHPKLRELVCRDLFDCGAASGDLRGTTPVFLPRRFVRRHKRGRLHPPDIRSAPGLGPGAGRANPAMTFVYVSGAGTNGKAMWAQIGGVQRMRYFYMFRLAKLQPMHDEISKTR